MYAELIGMGVKECEMYIPLMATRNSSITYGGRVVSPIIYRVIYMPGGVGFLPSTVSINK